MSDEYEHKLKLNQILFLTHLQLVHLISIQFPKQNYQIKNYHSHSWWTTYVFSQDAKYIGIQYALTAIGTGLLGLILSWLMRIQLAFPGLGLLEPAAYYQFVTMHGMIMVIYLLTALFLGGFGNLLILLCVVLEIWLFPM